MREAHLQAPSTKRKSQGWWSLVVLQFGGDGEKIRNVYTSIIFKWKFVTKLICNSTKGGGNASRLSGVVVPTWPVVEDGIQHKLSSGC
jgi:hypothetical protein